MDGVKKSYDIDNATKINISLHQSLKGEARPTQLDCRHYLSNTIYGVQREEPCKLLC